MNGALVAGWPVNAGSWQKETQPLLESIADHAGIAIAQAQQTEALQRLSNKDPLTGLYNRRAFMEELPRRLVRNAQQKRAGAFFYIDLDDFKNINDVGGHMEGDRVLTEVGAKLEHHIRQDDMAIRLGGDEFAIWFDEIKQIDAERKAGELLSVLKNIMTSEKNGKPISASIGIAIFDPDTDEDLESLIGRADEALYNIKEHGKGTWAIAPANAGNGE